MATTVDSAVDRAALKAQVCAAIDADRQRIVALHDELLRTPELGYKEFRTADLVARTFRELGLEMLTQLARTGVKAWLDGSAARPCVAILGELDALPVPGHPFADERTGAAHACGHHAQVAMMLGAAIGFVRSGIASKLGGRVAFVATPAEESVEVEWRLDLRARGEIEFIGGKQELLRLGVFDDVDLALLTHSSPRPETRVLAPGGTSNGHIVKWAHFTGRAAHAGAAPFAGVNALKAAILALMAIDAQRETYRDEDIVRIHPIITRGGDVVNVVPADVRIETFVRAKRLEALEDANAKVDRALRAGAMAIGAVVRIETLPGYLPLVNDPDLNELFRANAEALVGAEGVGRSGHAGYTTDAGDLSHIIPTAHPNCGGAVGRNHAPDFVVTDVEAGLIAPAKAMAMTAIDVLADGAATGRRILDAFRPRLTLTDYLTYQRRLASTEDFGELAPPTP